MRLALVSLIKHLLAGAVLVPLLPLLCLAQSRSKRPPAELRHWFAFSVARKDKPPFETTLDGPVVAVVQEPAPVLGAPLSGAGWIAFNALAAPTIAVR